ncbi:MAG: ribulose-phosphate 3-epimerase [Syntrophales bacterium]|nr:ribulose-phosphate 3-epimerase [Syntrophales bacterium]
MKDAIKVAPSLLSADFSRLGEEIKAVEEAGADWIHLDIMDGHFVPNITIGPAVVRSLRAVSRIPFDVHLMIENPERYIEAFAEAGSDLITVHVEASNHLNRTVNLIKRLGCKAGVSLNPANPLSLVEEILQDTDLLLIMSVNPGFGGQSFIGSSIGKIAKARKMADRLSKPPLIEVDGGITPENVAEVAAAGADIVVAGSAIFSRKDYAAVIKEMKANSSGKRRQKEIDKG